MWCRAADGKPAGCRYVVTAPFAALMSFRGKRIAARGLILALAFATPSRIAAQHDGDRGVDTAPGLRGHVAGHAIPLLTRATPTAGRQHLTEAYLSQPTVMALVTAAGGRLEAMAMLNLEGLTLARGELTTGTYGEGYVDRRHPHAYLHEVVVTLRTRDASRRGYSVSAGRGFAAFGSDDPMVRPFVKYPVNHHLAQVLERAMITGAARLGAAGIEASVFNGDETASPGDMPSFKRVGDSWAARVSVYPFTALELSASHASVESPEVPQGFGMDARKWHAAARLERRSLYALAEWAQSTDVDDGRRAATYTSALAEAAISRGHTRGALRLERTDRHEDDRLEDPFRTAPSTGDPHQLAVTRWTTVTAGASHEVGRWRGVHAAPFVELSVARVALGSGVAFDPGEFYGARSLAMLSAGFRLAAGTRHDRMGRYGVAASNAQRAHH